MSVDNSSNSEKLYLSIDIVKRYQVWVIETFFVYKSKMPSKIFLGKELLSRVMSIIADISKIPLEGDYLNDGLC